MTTAPLDPAILEAIKEVVRAALAENAPPAPANPNPFSRPPEPPPRDYAAEFAAVLSKWRGTSARPEVLDSIVAELRPVLRAAGVRWEPRLVYAGGPPCGGKLWYEIRAGNGFAGELVDAAVSGIWLVPPERLDVYDVPSANAPASDTSAYDARLEEVRTRLLSIEASFKEKRAADEAFVARLEAAAVAAEDETADGAIRASVYRDVSRWLGKTEELN